METIKKFLKSTFQAAAGVVLPLVLIAIVFEKVLGMTSSFTTPLAKTLFPEQFVTSGLAVRIVMFCLLVLASMLLGMFALTQSGRRLGQWIESRTLAHSKIYRGFREFSERLMPSGKDFLFQPALLKREDEMNALVFVVEKVGTNHVVIFMPSAPAAFSGALYVVPQSDVVVLKASAQDVVSVQARWGVGFSELLRTQGVEKELKANSEKSPSSLLDAH